MKKSHNPGLHLGRKEEHKFSIFIWTLEKGSVCKSQKELYIIAKLLLNHDITKESRPDSDDFDEASLGNFVVILGRIQRFSRFLKGIVKLLLNFKYIFW